MNNQELFKKIGGILTELRDQHTYLTEHPENLNEFELELFRANATFLSDHIHILQRSASTQPVRTAATISPALPPVEEPPVIEAPATIETGTFSFSAPFTPPSFLIPGVSPEPALEEESPAIVPPPPSLPVAEEPKKPQPTLNEILSAGMGTQPGTVGSQFSATDLKTAINLNDKLLFVKDLFNGYSLAYNEAIDLLNRYDSYESAAAFLENNYAVKNKWAEKKATAEKFRELVRKRFN